MLSAQLAWNASMHRDVADRRVLMERQAASMRRHIQSLGLEPVDSWDGGEGEEDEGKESVEEQEEGKEFVEE